MNSVLISGAPGFLGSRVVLALPLVEKVCLVRSSATITGCEMWNLDKIVPKPMDAFVHCAAQVHPDAGTHNIELTKRMLDIAKACQVKHFIFISSYVVETDAVTAYAVAKRAEEALVKESGIPFTIFRPTAIFGKGDKLTIGKLQDRIRSGKLMPLPAGGTAVMQPIFADDLAHLIASALDKKPLNKTYTVGGTPTCLRDMVVLISELEQKKKRTLVVPIVFMLGVVHILQLFKLAPIHSGQVRNLGRDFKVNLEPLQKDFNFVPTNFDKAIRSIYQ